MANLSGACMKILNAESYENLKETCKINNDRELVSYLLKQMFMIFDADINNISSLKPVIDKMVVYINQVVSNTNDLDSVLIVDRLMRIKEVLINQIKTTPKSQRNNPDIVFYKQTINDLEDIEVILQYNLPTDFIKTNSNVVKYILLKEKNLDLSESLINQHPYLMNICEDNGIHILDILVDHYLDSLNKYIETGDKKNLHYYNEVLRILLKERKVKIKDYVFDRNKAKVRQAIINPNSSFDKLVWLEHLSQRLTNPRGYNPGLELLNKIYDVKIGTCRAAVDECNNLNNDDSNSHFVSYIPSITIDDEDVMTRDDAVSVKQLNNGNYLVEIHITDVPKFVLPGSNLRKMAYKKTQTLYLPDLVDQMLPNELLTNKISLDEKQWRCVRSYCIEIDENGVAVDFKIKKQTINVSKNFSFDKATHILQHGSKDYELDYLFDNLTTATNLLRKNLGISSSKALTGESVVGTLMIYSSFKTAEYFKLNNYPMLFRSHDTKLEFPSYLQERLDEVDKNNEKYPMCIRKLMDMDLSSYYSTTPIHHEGLRLEQYTGITSPARRYGDIVNCDCEDIFYFNHCDDEKEVDRIREDLQVTAEYLNTRGRELKNYCAAYSRIKGKNR